jgi:hypothetical protein
LKRDGYRALVGRWAEGRVAVRSRHGSNLARAFPEIEEAFRRPPAATLYDPLHGTVSEEQRPYLVDADDSRPVRESELSTAISWEAAS